VVGVGCPRPVGELVIATAAVMLSVAVPVGAEELRVAVVLPAGVLWIYSELANRDSNLKRLPGSRRAWRLFTKCRLWTCGFGGVLSRHEKRE
jgi:hypothetical protein